MEPALQRVTLDQPFAYGLMWRSAVVAHVWWEQDATRRGAVGWYLRDMRAPAKTWRLLRDSALDDLARDARRPSQQWLEDAERLRTLTLAPALERAEQLVGETLAASRLPDDDVIAYEIYVRGLDLELLSLALPELPVSAGPAGHVVHADLSSAALERLLSRVRGLGGRVVAILPRPREP
jgi:hypothetical protein